MKLILFLFAALMAVAVWAKTLAYAEAETTARNRLIDWIYDLRLIDLRLH